ncbi:hypothetical protein EI555_013850 [Monodon monoceros]|uniref:Peptidyl-prolyl cis-trans isomerase n=1 Tax=Monodon monoceros TaxID=40151 RepID=A0A4U1EYP3_MONMO|nr:hypothetical protein EI555_013850 [Monodon monoceros]
MRAGWGGQTRISRNNAQPTAVGPLGTSASQALKEKKQERMKTGNTKAKSVERDVSRNREHQKTPLPWSLPRCSAVVNPAVFFDIAIDGESLGRVSFKLFAGKVPKTAENFHALSTGEKVFVYKGSCFHRIIPGFMCQGACSPGILSMANAGPNTSISQFFICAAKTEWLGGKHVVWGKVKEGVNIVEAMERFGSKNGKTNGKMITIADCGQI